MALTLLAMCQRALYEKAEFAVPATIIGNTDPSALRLRYLADRTGRFFHRNYFWQKLMQVYTFPTVASTSTYALPSDYQRMVNLTQWDRTTFAPLKGPVSAVEFETMRSGAIAAAAGLRSYWRLAANLFEMYPTPSSVRTIAYQYIGLYWIAATGSSTATKEYFTVDTDTCIFDDDLMVLGIKEHFDAVALGVPFEPSGELTAMIGAAVGADGAKDVISFGESNVVGSILGMDNLPETGFGV